MGNRAVLTMSAAPSAPAIYLHWNGGRASIEGFLNAARIVGIDGRAPNAIDQLAELIAKRYFHNPVGFTVYREKYGNSDKDNGDNGVYLISTDLEIIGREFKRYAEEINAEKTTEIANEIIKNLLPNTEEMVSV